MNKIVFFTGGSISRVRDAAILRDGDDPRESLIEEVIQSISTTVEVTVGDVTMHLAAWMDPEHWEDDWLGVGIADVDALLSSSVEFE